MFRRRNDAAEVAAALDKVRSFDSKERSDYEAYRLAVSSPGRYRVSYGDALRRGAARRRMNGGRSVVRDDRANGWRRFVLAWLLALVAALLGSVYFRG